MWKTKARSGVAREVRLNLCLRRREFERGERERERRGRVDDGRGIWWRLECEGDQALGGGLGDFGCGRGEECVSERGDGAI